MKINIFFFRPFNFITLINYLKLVYFLIFNNKKKVIFLTSYFKLFIDIYKVIITF